MFNTTPEFNLESRYYNNQVIRPASMALMGDELKLMEKGQLKLGQEEKNL